MGFKFYSTNKIFSAGALSLQGYTGGSWYTITAVSGSLGSVIDRNRHSILNWSSSSYAYTKIEATLGSQTLINTIAIQNHNFDTFDLIINGITKYSWSNNNDSSTIYSFDTITAATVTIVIQSTTSDADEFLGQLIACNEQYELPHNPNFSDYKPALTGVRESKKMADGGYVTYTIAEKFQADIGLKYVPPTVTSELKSIYSATSAWLFCPYPTSSGWDGDIWEVNWIGKFDFLKPARNERANPLYNGVIKLRETPA